MASVRRRQTGWNALWRDASGKQCAKFFADSVYGEDSSEATARAFCKQINTGMADVPAPGQQGITLRRYVLRVWLPRSGLKASTRRAMESALNQLPGIADQPIGWVANHRTAVEDAIAASERVDHGPLYMVVKRSLDDAVNRDYIGGHKLAGLKVQRSYARREHVDTTAEQRQRLAKRLGDRELAFWILYGCGLRIGECIALKGSDFRNGFTSLHIQRTADMGKSSALKMRSRGQGRNVPVPEWLAVKVKAHVQAKGLGPLFPGREKEFCSWEAVGRKISQEALKMGLRGFTPHHMRHDYVTRMLDAGMKPAHLSDYTGDNLDVLMNVYSHVTGRAFDADRSIIDGMGQ